MAVLTIDVGTSGVRAVVVDRDGRISHEEHHPLLPASPAPGLVEFDPTAMAVLALELARSAIAAGGPVDAVAVANQRSSTIVWDRVTGEPVGPGLGWQDQRTADRCAELLADGYLIPPNMSATKVAWLLERAGRSPSELAFGTIDTWIAWHLSGGDLHVTDPTNAAITGVWSADADGWDAGALAACGLPTEILPTVIDSSGVAGTASALVGAPPIAALAGDQQASLVGQGCVDPGATKITFGTGGMLDICLGEIRPTEPWWNGSIPLPAWRAGGDTTWMLEAVILSAGTCIEWLRDGLGLVERSAEVHELADTCDSSDGVTFVPALAGLGTPTWDFDARGTFLGISRGTSRAHLARAVLEGIAQRAADLVEAAEADSGLAIDTLRVDGGMTANPDHPVFVQAVADATQRRVEVAPVTEATAVGAARLAGVAVGVWDTWADPDAWRPAYVAEPQRSFDREQWKRACGRAGALSPDLGETAS